MRIIGGNARGRRLKVPKGRDLRPTAARVKEALFNILPHDLTGAKILDLYAGTGNLTIEALSRGAAEAILIDSSPQSGKAIRENLRRLDLFARTKVWITPVSRALRLLARRGETFDMIFLDPPYDQRLVESTLNNIAKGGLLRDCGVVIAEHSRHEPVKAHYAGLVLDDQRHYGGTDLSFFRKAL
ncbi:MAG TPA: 16S rRNA (guanine(966)-N(2))-methyltransferase RsmD [Candidatus Binatia bacterium]|nr:16S rRNA (guanine(966)-N(2))-methyltransferase RsmD [Candidatus Binatia bacterium]